MKKRLRYIGAAILLVFFITLTSLTILPEQEHFGWYVFFVFSLLFATRKKSGLFLRILVFVLAFFLATRYMLFRVLFTLKVGGTLGFWCGIVLFIAELYCFILYFLNLFVNIQPIRRKIPDLPEILPSIDVFIPTYNEDEEVAYTTALACKNFDYPAHLVTIYILNDGGRLPRLNKPELTESLLARHQRLSSLAAQAGVHYLTREDGEQAKAGMINAALKGEAFKEPIRGEDGKYIAGQKTRTTGDIILILDCDHIPSKDLLKNVVGHFKDEKMALVQTPHFMINADPIRKNTATEDLVPDESWLFYFGTQLGLDRWGASYFCGSAAMLRRSALHDVGWISGDTITEDAETALALHSKGYHSAYVDIPMVAGLAPESFDTMIRQRIRWCQGMLQILILKNPLFSGKLNLAQRLCYLNNCLYWLFPLSRFIFLISPLMFLFFNIDIYNASRTQVINFGFPYLFSSTMMFVYLFGKRRLFLQSEISEMMQSFFLLPAIISVIISPRKPSFAITAKGMTSDKDAPSPQAPLLFFFFSLIVLGFGRALYLWLSDPLSHEATSLTAFWNVYNFFIVLCCLGVVWERKQRRQFHRIVWHGKSQENAILDGCTAEIKNLSSSGFSLMISEGDFSIGQNVEYRAKSFSRRAIITRIDSTNISGSFIDSDFKETLAYIYGDSQRWKSVIESFSGGESYIINSLKALVKMMSSSLLCLIFFLLRILNYLKKPACLIAILIIAILIYLNQAKGETSSTSLESLLYAPDYTLSGLKGELQVPFYLSKRAKIKTASITLHYTRENANNLSPLDINMEIDAQEVSAIQSGNAQKGSALLTIPEEKLIPGERTALIEFSQKIASNTTIDLKQSTLNVDYSLSPLGAHSTDLDYLFEPEITTPKTLAVVLEKNDIEHIRRAMFALQNISIRLVDRPLHIYLVSEPNSKPTMDCLFIGDSYRKNRPTLEKNARYALLTEDDFAIKTISRRTILEMGTSMSFDEIGLGTVFFRQFSSPRFSDFIIPSKAWLSPNLKLKIELNLLYSAGMPPGASLDIMVNNKMIANIHLNNKKGEFQARYIAEIPTSLLNSGRNRLWLRPNLSDKNSQKSDNELYITIFPSSSIYLPVTAIHTNTPDLKNLFTDGYPFVGNSDVYLQDNSNEIIESFLNFSAIIGQKRGSIGEKVRIHIEPYIESEKTTANKPTVFSSNDKLPEEIVVLDSKTIDKFSENVSLSFQANTASKLAVGTRLLWSPEIQSQLKGTKSEINLNTKEVKNGFGAIFIISTILSLQLLEFYVSNYPTLASIIIFSLLLILGGIIWLSLRDRKIAS